MEYLRFGPIFTPQNSKDKTTKCDKVMRKKTIATKPPRVWLWKTLVVLEKVIKFNSQKLSQIMNDLYNMLNIRQFSIYPLLFYGEKLRENSINT